MFPDLPYMEIIIVSVFLALVFFLSGEAAHWSGMKLEEIEQRIAVFKQKRCRGELLPGYPVPLLISDHARYEGGVSWRRGLSFFCSNLLLAGVVYITIDRWWVSLLVLAPILFAERVVLKQLATSRRQTYIKDLGTCALYYEAHLRISGDLKWVMACSSRGRMVDLRIVVQGSSLLSDGEYSFIVHVPEHLDGRYITYERRASFNVFNHPVSLFLRVRDSEIRIDTHVAELELHALYPGVLAPNTERDLRVASSFAYEVLPKKQVPPPVEAESFPQAQA